MNGFGAYLKKEWREVRSTSRKWVLPGILAFCAAAGVLLAYLLPLIIESTATQPGITIEVAEPTVIDAYRQYFQQLSQFALIAVIIATAGLISSELRNGSAVLVLTKPVSRAAFVVGKLVSQVAVLTAATLLSVAIFAAMATALFGSVSMADLLGGVGLWLAMAVFVVFYMVLISSAVDSHAAAAGIGLAAYAIIALAGMWEPLKAHSPAGLLSAAGATLEGRAADVVWPLLSTAALCAAVLLATVWSFRRREI